MTKLRSPIVSRGLRVSGQVESGESISMDDCRFVSEFRSIGLWRICRLLAQTSWQPLLSARMADTLFLDHPSPKYQLAVWECIGPIAVAAAGADTERATLLGVLRHVISRSLARDAVGHLRTLAETWRDIDPLGYAQLAHEYGRDPYPGLSAESIDTVSQRIIERLLASDVPDERLAGLRMLEGSDHDCAVDAT